jgi:glycosyltransferase involved in cell wall biosynthesis
MKVALFVHCFYPDHFYGTETYTLQVAKGLRSSGIDVVVVTAVFPGEARQSASLHRYDVEGIPVISFDKNDLPNTRVKDTYYQEGMRAPLATLLAEERPDLIHVTHLINHTAVLLEVAAQLGIPCVATFTDFFGFCYNNKLETADSALCAGPSPSRRNCLACHLKAISGQAVVQAKPLQWAARFGANPLGAFVLDKARKLDAYRHGEIDGLVEDIRLRPDILAACYAHYRAVIAPTRFLETAYRRNGFDRPMTRSWFGVDFDRSPKIARPANRPVVFGFIGQLAPHKGTDLLIEAFGRLPRGRAELHIYGPADQDPVFMRRLTSLAEGHDVRFLGTFEQHRTREILDTMDLLVIPSRWYENSPLVLLNALASHTPVLVSNVEGMTEFIEEGVDGLSFERGNVSSIEACLRRFVDDPSLATRMSANTRFARDTRAMVDDVIDVYRQVVPLSFDALAA